MDLQGNPLPHGHRSTKVTNDPAATRNPIYESAGLVPTDSLAAASTAQGGAFSQNTGIHTTSSTTAGQSTHHTSSTTKLPAAPVGGLREDRNRQEKYPEALGGQGDFPGAHGDGYVGGPTAAKQQQAAAASGSGSGYSHIGGQAPSYVSDVTGLPGQGKPKGKNLHEGGFDDDPRHNASFNSEIGNQNDPSRAAERTFQSRAAEGGVEVGGARQKGVESHHGGFETLERDQRA